MAFSQPPARAELMFGVSENKTIQCTRGLKCVRSLVNCAFRPECGIIIELPFAFRATYTLSAVYQVDPTVNPTWVNIPLFTSFRMLKLL